MFNFSYKCVGGWIGNKYLFALQCPVNVDDWNLISLVIAFARTATSRP